MIDAEFIKWLVQDFGMVAVVIVLGAMVASKWLEYLRQQANADILQQKAYDKQKTDDSRAWLELISGLKISIDGQNMIIIQAQQTTQDRDIVAMAYQNTSTSALTELVIGTKKLNSLPDGLRQANESLGKIHKMQFVSHEDDVKSAFAVKSQLEKTDKAIGAMQVEVRRLAVAMEKLPSTLQNTIAPLVGMMQSALATAQSGLDDMPLVQLEDGVDALTPVMVVDTSYASSNGDSPPPLHEEDKLDGA